MLLSIFLLLRSILFSLIPIFFFIFLGCLYVFPFLYFFFVSKFLFLFHFGCWIFYFFLLQPAGPAHVSSHLSNHVPAQTSAPAAVEVATPAASLPSAAVAQQSEAARPARPQGDVLAAYRQHLTELFARGYEYPRIAALRGWEGEVRLRLKVARKGNLLGVTLDRSSGFDVLDQHAQALLASYGDLPPLPEALEASEIQVIVPINYKLRKTT